MGVVIPEGYAQGSIVLSNDGATKEYVTTIGLFSVALTPATAQGLADDLYAAAVATGSLFVAANFFNEWAFVGTKVTLMTDTGPIEGQHLDFYGGTATGESITVNTAVLAKKNTASGGRKNRGRMYFPPIWLSGTTVNSAGLIDDTQRASIQDKFDTFYDELVASDIAPVLLHSGADVPTPITSFSVESLVATQRRRLRS